jgi:hypothetical protein
MSQLNRMASLAYLDLQSCHLSPTSGRELAETLKNENKIVMLSLADNELGDEGVNAILGVLLTNETLTELNISSNHFKSSIIDQFIASNQVIFSLDISKNSIGDDGALAIAAALPQNASLARLSVASCRISDSGAAAIAEAVAHNTGLTNLKLNDNFLTRECGYLLLEFIRLNERIRTVDISATQIDNFVLKAMKEICQRNIQLQKEIGLQPLKRDVIQLSIQRTKMPEAISRLRALEDLRARLELDVVDLDHAYEDEERSATENHVLMQKSVQGTLDQIADERRTMEKIAADREACIKDYDDRYAEVLANTEKEKIMTKKHEDDIVIVENFLVENNEAMERERAELLDQIRQIRELLEQTREIVDDPEVLREYEPPELPAFMGQASHPFFLNDEILDLKDEEEGKKGKKRRRSSSPKSPKKKGAKSKTVSPRLPPPDPEEIGEEQAEMGEEQAAPAPAAKSPKTRPKSAAAKSRRK